MRSRWFGFVVAALAALASLFFWSRLPEQVPTHWNIHGEVDGYSSRFWAALLMPLLIVGIVVLRSVLPRIDPRGANYEKFQGEYWTIVNVLAAFLLVIHAATLAFAVGVPVDITRVVTIGVGLLFVVLGNYLGRVRPNWFIGIRTPWTLENAEVWRRTHRVGGRLFVAAGVLTIAASFLRTTSTALVTFGAVMVAALASVVMSLVYWRQERGK